MVAATAVFVYGGAALAQTPPATPEGRRAIAKQMETIWLRGGVDMHVTAEGAEARIMRMKWPLIGRVFVQQVQDDPKLLRNLKSSGFTKLIATDGHRFTATWDLMKTQ